MKKILSLLLICIMLSCSLAGCGSDGDDDGVDFITIVGRPFMVINDVGGIGYSNDLIVDINEKTQYYYAKCGNGGRAIILLVDSEGKPLLYEGEIPYYGGEVGK